MNPHERCWTPSPTTKAGRPRKRNDYPMLCADCGAVLAPGEGYVEKSRQGWIAWPVNGNREMI